MANKFWVGGAGSWSDTTHWATSTGGAGSTGIPATGDAVTFDGASGGGNVVCDVVTGLSLLSLTAGAFTGTLDFTGTNPSLTFTASSTAALNLSGTGARKYLLGSGTFTFTGNNGTLFDIGTTTGLDVASVTTATLAFTGNNSVRSINGGGRTLGAVTIATTSTPSVFRIFSNNTFASLTVGAGVALLFPVGGTTTISGASTLTGVSTNPIVIAANDIYASGNATVSFSAGTSTMDWGTAVCITTSGAGTFTATNSLFQRVTLDTGDTISVPSGGGGVVGVIGG